VNVSNKWKFPKKGDLVVRTDDRERGIELVGLVTESGRKRRDKIRTDIRVLWASDTYSWHHAFQLEVINESR